MRVPSPRPAISARTVSGRTPGWSPSISTSASARGSTAPTPAAIDEEQPLPYPGFSTTSAPLRSTSRRTRSELPPSATTSWSKSHARAVAIT